MLRRLVSAFADLCQRSSIGVDAPDEGDSSNGSDTPGGEGGPTPVTDGGTSQTGTPQRRKLRHRDWVRALPFWLPPFLLIGLFVYGAISWNFVISLTGWEGLGDPSYSQLDFDMYVQFFERFYDGAVERFSGDGLRERLFQGDTQVAEYKAFTNTVTLLVVFTVASLVVGLVVAILVDRGIRFENTFRTIYLLPMALSFVVTAILWRWMYRPEGGVINELLTFVLPGTYSVAWLSNPELKLYSVIFALIWQFSGYCMIVYLAGLRAIPDDHYEAARVDGASTLRLYWRVILPQLRASTTSAAVVLMVFGLKAFDFIFVIFGSATPGPSADIMPILMYREAFGRTNWAYGSAVATLLFLMALGIIAPYLYAQYRRGDL